MSGPRRFLDPLLDRGVKLAFIVAACAMAYAALFPAGGPIGGRLPEEPPLPTEPVSLQGVRLTGDEAARVILLEYGDYQCLFCSRFARETQPLLEEKYVRTGKVRLGYLHLPLPDHSLAPKAAEAAECAGLQGRFWEMHERLFTPPPKLSDPDLIGHAQDLELDMALFDQCLGGQMAGKVQADAALAMQHGVSSTPTFFIGAMRPDGTVGLLHRLSGAQPPAAFEKLLDQALAAAEAGAQQQSR